MSEQGKTDINQRIRAWKAECVANGLKYKEVIERAEMDYNSVINAIGSALNGNTKVISSKRLHKLEQTTLLMILEKALSNSK
ncbi:MAG: hypothetical protein ABJR05_15710 [Balneola sp.]